MSLKMFLLFLIVWCESYASQTEEKNLCVEISLNSEVLASSSYILGLQACAMVYVWFSCLFLFFHTTFILFLTFSFCESLCSFCRLFKKKVFYNLLSKLNPRLLIWLHSYIWILLCSWDEALVQVSSTLCARYHSGEIF